MEKSYQYATFDLFKILAASAVVVGHAYINFFKSWFHHNEHIWICEGIESIAVSVFFICSGIFLALSVERLTGQNPFEVYSAIIKKRFIRLYEPFLLVCVIYALIERFLFHKITIKEFLLFWPNIFMIGNINNIPGNNIVWYVVALFWCTLPILALLAYKKSLAVSLFFPLLLFLGFSYLYTRYGCVSVHSQPVLDSYKFISAGLVRGFVELTIGIETFYVSKSFSKKFLIKPTAVVASLTIFLEACCLLLLAVVCAKKGNNKYDFLTYPTCAVLFFIFLLRREIIFLFASTLKKPIFFLSRYTYMLYLTHTLLIQPAKFFVDFSQYDFYTVLFVTLAVCWLFAIILYHLNTLLVRRMNSIWQNLLSPISTKCVGGEKYD